MRRFTVFTVFLLVAAFSIGCAPSSDSGATPVPTTTPEPAILTHQLEVTLEPTETAIVLLNPTPFGDREYVHGRTVTIDVLPQPGWEVNEWLGPVFDVAGRTAKVNMTSSHSIIVSLVRSSAGLATQKPILGRATKPPATAAKPLSPPTSPGGSAEILVPSATLTSAPTPVHGLGGPAPCSAKVRTAYIESKGFDSQGEYKKAIEKLNEVIRLDPQCASAYSSRGFARLHIGQNQQALQDYNEAIRLAPEAEDLYYSYYNRGFVYSDLGQHRRGIQDFNEAIRLLPGQGWLYDGRATVYDRMGDLQKANADRNKACQLNVDRAYCGATERPAPAVVPTAKPKPTATLAPTRTPTPTPTLVPTLTPVPTIQVSKTADTYDGTCNADCSLREAIIAAGPGAIIRIPAGTYTLVIQELTIFKDLTLIGTGPDKTIIQAANSAGTATHRVFNIERDIHAYMSGITIRYGREVDPSGGFGGGISNDGVLSLVDVVLGQNGAIHGGGIYNNGTLTMTDSAVEDNQSAIDGGGISNDGRLVLENTTIIANESESGAGIHNGKQAVITGSRIIGNKASLNGGGILSREELTLTNTIVKGNESNNAGGGIISNGRLVLTDSTIEGNIGGIGGGIHQRLGLTATGSTISGNTAKHGDGGGIYIEYGDVLTFTNVTVSDNTASEKGGGFFISGNAELTLSNSTITGNRAKTDGGGVYNEGKLTFVNSILAGNSVGRKGPDCYGDTISLGHNIIGDKASCGWLASVGDVVGIVFNPVDPKLGPLLDNGGPAKTHAILAGSPAIDAGDNAYCPADDQRGTPRPQGTACDIGAYEK